MNPTEEAEGYTAHKCGMCGFEWNDTFVDKLVVLKGGEEAMALKNEEAYLNLRLANSDLLTAITMKVEFDADTFEYVGVNRDDVTVDTSEADEGILTVTSQNENGFTNWDGDLFAIIEFKVKTDAEAGDKELKASVTAAKKGETDVTVEGGVATTKVTVTKYMRGDVDQNGFVNPADITYMLRHFSGEDLLDETEKGLGDMDRNGTFSIVDALYLLRAQATNP